MEGGGGGGVVRWIITNTITLHSFSLPVEGGGGCCAMDNHQHHYTALFLVARGRGGGVLCDE